MTAAKIEKLGQLQDWTKDIASLDDNKNFVILFDKSSIVMKNFVGLPARGSSFYQRDREIEKVTKALANGNNMQMIRCQLNCSGSIWNVPARRKQL